jgi:hypothetical protein
MNNARRLVPFNVIEMSRPYYTLISLIARACVHAQPSHNFRSAAPCSTHHVSLAHCAAEDRRRMISVQLFNCYRDALRGNDHRLRLRRLNHRGRAQHPRLRECRTSLSMHGPSCPLLSPGVWGKKNFVRNHMVEPSRTKFLVGVKSTDAFLTRAGLIATAAIKIGLAPKGQELHTFE